MYFLEPTAEEKLAFANLKFDSKKSYWAPDKKHGGFCRALLKETELDKKGRVELECDGGEVLCEQLFIEIKIFKCFKIIVCVVINLENNHENYSRQNARNIDNILYKKEIF